MRTSEAARGRWRHILCEVGVDPKFLRNVHGPCPGCGGDDRFRFDDEDGRGTFYCNQCGAGDGVQLFRMVTGLSLTDSMRRIDELIGNRATIERDPDRGQNMKRILTIWQATQPAGLLVRRYLKGRGLSGVDLGHLREHPALEYWDNGQLLGHYPAMVAKFTNPEGEGSTLHMTYLTHEGQKAQLSPNKKWAPVVRSMSGGAIRLCDHGETLAIAEGIENALAVMQHAKVPCWAAGDADKMSKFEVPSGVKRLVIYADRDGSYTGQASAYQLAKRAAAKNVEVEVELPANYDRDWLEQFYPS